MKRIGDIIQLPVDGSPSCGLSADEGAALMEQAEAAGVGVQCPPSAVADPEGQAWEITCSASATRGPDGAFRWNGYG